MQKNDNKKNKSKLSIKDKIIWVILSLTMIVGIGMFLYGNPYTRDFLLQENAKQALRQDKDKVQAANKDNKAYLEAMKNGNKAKAEQALKNLGKGKSVSYDWSKVEPMNSNQAANARLHAESVSLGAIAIPSVGMYLPVVAGVSSAALSTGGGTMCPGQVMGQGNYPLAGHYLSTKGPLFSPIASTQVGSYVYLTDLETVYAYKIYSKFHASPRAVYLTENTLYHGKPITTLITCADGGADRWVVRAYLTEEKPATTSTMKIFRNLYY